MTKYIKNHENYILNQISNQLITKDLQDYHRNQIKLLQHERLIHLLVMMLVSFLLIGFFIFMMISFSIASLSLVIIFFVLDCFYIHHYYILENTVQRWYKIDNELNNQLWKIGTNLYKNN